MRIFSINNTSDHILECNAYFRKLYRLYAKICIHIVDCKTPPQKHS